jgi:hypothetical protein
MLCHAISGDFEGDVTDDVSSLDEQGCNGLVGWLKFYHEVSLYHSLLGRYCGAAAHTWWHY